MDYYPDSLQVALRKRRRERRNAIAFSLVAMLALSLAAFTASRAREYVDPPPAEAVSCSTGYVDLWQYYSYSGLRKRICHLANVPRLSSLGTGSVVCNPNIGGFDRFTWNDCASAAQVVGNVAVCLAVYDDYRGVALRIIGPFSIHFRNKTINGVPIDNAFSSLWWC